MHTPSSITSSYIGHWQITPAGSVAMPCRSAVVTNGLRTSLPLSSFVTSTGRLNSKTLSKAESPIIRYLCSCPYSSTNLCTSNNGVPCVSCIISVLIVVALYVFATILFLQYAGTIPVLTTLSDTTCIRLAVAMSKGMKLTPAM